LAELNNPGIIYLHLGTGILECEEISLAEKMGVHRQVHFVGNTNSVRDYLVASDAYIMPSFFEGLSIASIEAMACKTPCVLYNSPGLSDLIDKNNNGLLIDRNSSEIAKAILWIMNQRAKVNQMVENAFTHVNQEYGMSCNAGKIVGLYRKLLSRP
jgi:glycosyltransferase involved in cell wall biosynthesis